MLHMFPRTETKNFDWICSVYSTDDEWEVNFVFGLINCLYTQGGLDKWPFNTPRGNFCCMEYILNIKQILGEHRDTETKQALTETRLNEKKNKKNKKHDAHLVVPRRVTKKALKLKFQLE